MSLYHDEPSRQRQKGNVEMTRRQKTHLDHQGADEQSQTRCLNLHDTYDVQRDLSKVVRDFLQNFYDSLPSERFDEEVEIDVNRRSKIVTIRGPGQFDLDYLLRIGASTKSHAHDQYAGGFGEGFAIATLVIMRDYPVSVVARVGVSIAEFFFAGVMMKDQDIRDLCCRIKDNDAGDVAAGNEVVIRNCPSAVMQAFEEGRKYFRYDGNPLFGKILGKKPEAGVYVYRSTLGDGSIFYGRQRRAAFELPFIICHDRSFEDIGWDRDRSDLSKEEIRALLAYSVQCLSADVVEHLVLNDLKDLWVCGHPLITALGEYWRQMHGYSDEGRHITFPEGYLAKSNADWKSHSDAEDAGLTLCNKMMAAFGMKTTRKWAQEMAAGMLRSPT